MDTGAADLWQLVVFATLFVLPGHVGFSTFGLFAPEEKLDEKRWLLRSLAASLCYYAVIFSAVGPWVFTQDARRWIDRHPGWLAALVALAMFLVIPAVFGGAIGWLLQVRWMERVFQFTPRIRAPTAWAAMLSSPRLRGREILTRVQLDDGTTVAGLWSGGSRAGEHASRDLYFDVEFVEANEGKYVPVPASAGLWIEGSRIRAIRFTEVQEPQTHDEIDQAVAAAGDAERHSTGA